MARRTLCPWLLILITSLLTLSAEAATRTWVGGNDPWDTDIFNWSGNDEPDPDDDAVFNTNNNVDMAMDNEILSLDLSNDITLSTQNYSLDVGGDIELTDTGTRLRAGQNDLAGLPATSLSAYNITVNTAATFQNANFTSVISPTDIGLFDVNPGGTLYGNGTIRNGDGINSPTVVFENDGVIRPGEVSDLLVIGPPPSAFTLTLAAIDGDARIDLDGASGTGAVDITRNQTLDIDVELNDAFDGTIDLAHNATLDIEDAWGLSGTLNVDNGLVPGSFPIPDIAPDVAYLQGGEITATGSATTINVFTADSTLQFDTPFTASEGTINNNGLVVFNNDTTINSDVDFQMIGVTASITVGSGATVTVNDADMDFDGSGANTNVITVEAGGTLDLNLDSFESNDRADGFLTLNSGTLELTVSDGAWTMDRRLTLNNSGGGDPVLSGSAVVIGGDSRLMGVPDADVRVEGDGASRINSAVTWNSDAEVDVEAGATLAVLGFSTFNTVNGTESAQFDGPGDIFFSGGQVNEEVVLNFSGGTVGLDGGGALVVVLSAPDFTVDAPLTINAAELSEYGRRINFPALRTSELTINSNLGGRLDVNLDDPNDTWTVNNVGVMHVNGGNLVFSAFLTGNDLNMSGDLNVDGLARSDARVIVGATGVVDFVDAAANLRLTGGNLNNPNRIEGGQIIGPGEISATNNRSLRGFGTIGVSIDFDGANSQLLADDGTLVINPAASILDVGVLGTADTDGILDVQQNWSTSVTSSVRLAGGQLDGATILNDGAGGISGNGFVSAPLNNDSVVSAEGGVLVVDNAVNANDWDGPGNAGTLRALTGSTLELHDNAPFLFMGTVAATSAAVESHGFELEFDPGSTLRLENGGIYRSTNATDIGGSVMIGAGNASRIQVPGTIVFENTSSTTLAGDLEMVTAVTRVEAGATFTGGGALLNPAGSTLVLEDGADVDVLVQNNGTLALGNSPGQASGIDFEQTETGIMEIELEGTGLTDYDRMTLSGVAQLGGLLDVSLIGGFNPLLNDTFTILTAASVTGSFSVEDFSGAVLDTGLAWDVIYNTNNVQLAVIDILPGDFNNDGVVSAADYTVWRDNLGAPPGTLPNDPNGSPIGSAQYATWKANFGATFASSAAFGAATVPEPAALVLIGIALLVCFAQPLELDRTRCRPKICGLQEIGGNFL